MYKIVRAPRRYIMSVTKISIPSTSGIPEFRSFGQKGKFSTFGFQFRPPKVKAEYGRNSRKALDFFFPSVFQDENIMAWFLNPFLAVNFC